RRSEAPRPEAPRPEAPPRRRTRRPGARLAVGQIICWQVAVLLIALSLRQPWPVVVAASAGAVALLAPTAVRVRGRWLYELALLGCRFLFRARRHDLPKRDDTGLPLLGLLLPGSTVRTVGTSQGPLMAISHPRGIAAIIQPKTLADNEIAALPAPAALLPESGAMPYRFGVQSVFHAGARLGAPAAVWFAVHVVRRVQAPTDDELTLALRNGLRRVRRALGRAGVSTEPLPEEAALAAVARLAHVTAGRNELRENWRFWRTGTVSQACFALDGWDRLAEPDAQRLVGELVTRTPGVAVTMTLTAFAGPSGVHTGALLRLAAITEAAVDAAAGHMSPLLSSTGVHLTRLDGEHLSGVAASLPIGGFLP
ncbi:type VII secretion protein EccE, partial [Allorhizocola rhizosphaerae]|uniref:type VII secretion protein EccE n=1 Tax=Allorhizocola rhizosphaerae TaxID=1872709 RepID=UPI000E3E43E3